MKTTVTHFVKFNDQTVFGDWESCINLTEVLKKANIDYVMGRVTKEMNLTPVTMRTGLC